MVRQHMVGFGAHSPTPVGLARCLQHLDCFSKPINSHRGQSLERTRTRIWCYRAHLTRSPQSTAQVASMHCILPIEVVSLSRAQVVARVLQHAESRISRSKLRRYFWIT